MRMSIPSAARGWEFPVVVMTTSRKTPAEEFDTATAQISSPSSWPVNHQALSPHASDRSTRAVSARRLLQAK